MEMTFKFNDFIVQTESKIIELDEQIIAPISIDSYSSKPKMGWKYKTKEITIFKLCAIKNNEQYYAVIFDIFIFIDFIEILKAFSGNKLNTSKEYHISNKFTARTAQKDGDMYLKIHFTNYSTNLYLDKFECSSLSAKFSKILQRCEAWQESDQ